jgi:lipopolysaccharide heptosyltransferase II
LRILVYQTAYLGDVVLTTPLLATLRKQFPKAYIACVVQPAWALIVERSGCVDEVIPFDKRGKEKGLGGTFGFAGRLRKKRFDIALCPHPSFRSGLILRLAGISRRIGFDDASGRFFFTEKLHRDSSAHEVDRVLTLADALGIKKDQRVRELKLKADSELDVDGLLESRGIPRERKGLILVHPGSVWATKRWKPEGFGTVCMYIAQKGIHVGVLGTEKERELVEEVVANAGEERVIPIVGLSLAELLAVIPKSLLYVTNDSGPMHIACALGIPAVAIFGSTVPAQGYAPFSSQSYVIEADRLDCRPCGPHGFDKCPKDHFFCMKKIEPFSVLFAVQILTGGFEGTGFSRALLVEK